MMFDPANATNHGGADPTLRAKGRK